MGNVVFFMASALDVRTLSVIDDIRNKRNVIYVDCSSITGYQAQPLRVEPAWVRVVNLNDFLLEIGENSEMHKEIVFSLPINISTLKLFIKIRTRSEVLSTISLYIPWDSTAKVIIKSFVYKLIYRINGVYSFGYLYGGEKLFSGKIKYKRLPGIVDRQVSHTKVKNRLAFIDQGLPMHPDLSSTKKTIGKVSYYKYINDILSEISERIGVPVIICKHPSVIYDGSEFGPEFEVSEDHTRVTVGDSAFVAGHYSMSLVEAAYLGKNILIIQIPGHISKHFRKEIASFAGLLKISPINKGFAQDEISRYISLESEKSRLVDNYMYKLCD
jgi:hypothetical protein